MNKPLVSVIITTKNEEKNIANCLKSIRQQTYPQDKIEIIIVDNNSSDQTKVIAKKYTDLVFNEGPERSAQRNFGVAQSSADFILYLDADMILSPQVIKECVNKVQQNKKIIALYIPEIIMGNSYWCKVRRFERSFYNGTVIDAVRFINKQAFLQANGFDETMSGPEDWDFDKKIKQLGQVAVISSSLYHNESEFNLKKYLAKKAYYSQSFDKYIAKWGKDDPDIKKQLGLFYRYFGVFMEKGKWKKIINNPIFTIGVYYLKALIGFSYINKKNEK